MGAVATELEVSPTDTGYLAAVAGVAEQQQISESALKLQGLLHLPRVADADGVVDAHTAEHELHALAADIRTRSASAAGMADPPARLPQSPRELIVREDLEQARQILTQFHYLGSFRRASEHFVCFTQEGKPVALATVSPLDLGTIGSIFPAPLSADRVRVLSRVYAFDWAPPNTLTWLFRRVVRRIRASQKTQLLVTYVNPNMGFTGASYRAGNWSLVAREEGTRYAYLDARYITDRELIQRYGTSDPSRLERRLAPRIAYSHMPLRPLEIFALPLTGAAREALAAWRPRTLPRPTP